MKVGDRIVTNLGNLCFGGTIIMVTPNAITVELPCGIIITTTS